jgi:hypothetical protein
MHILGGGMTYNRVHILYHSVYIYTNIKRFSTTFMLDKYLCSKLKVLHSNMEMYPPVNCMPDFYAV